MAVGKRPVFARVGRKLVQGHAKRLGRGSGNQQRRPRKLNPRADQILEQGKLGPDKIGERDPFPGILDKQVLACGQRLDAVAEAFKEVLRDCSR